jgi:hypothetical protein
VPERGPVIIRLTGGLGNQMFQYAAALAFCERTGGALQLDLSRSSDDPDRPFLLRKFRVDEPVAKPEDIAALEGQSAGWRRRVIGAAPALSGLVARGRYNQPSFRFDPALSRFSPPLLMTGSFQSEQFFADIRPTLIERFTLRDALGAEVQARADAIAATPLSVAVHVRRGDYITNASANKFHGVCSVDFYRQAVAAMRARVGDTAHFFLFSDDPQWVSQNFDFLKPMTVVSHPASTAWVDIALISRCRHMITANSSFSWWGAWLGQATDKVVVCPKYWVRNDGKTILETADLQPGTWLKIDAPLV